MPEDERESKHGGRSFSVRNSLFYDSAGSAFPPHFAAWGLGEKSLDLLSCRKNSGVERLVAAGVFEDEFHAGAFRGGDAHAE